MDGLEKEERRARDDNPPGSVAERIYTETCNQQAAVGMGRRETLVEQAEKSSVYHAERAQKSANAATFFRLHPEFMDFIELIRQGAIQI